MIELLKQALAGQFEAALCMLDDCIRRCPDEHWDGLIAKYPFWHVAYHTLCFVDVYLSRNDAAWRPQTGPGGLHPLGRTELDEEYPSRRFERRELGAYVALCREKVSEALAHETAESLAGPSGFPRLRFSRAELYLYNLRHLNHHLGQLTAHLHRLGFALDWVSSGRR